MKRRALAILFTLLLIPLVAYGLQKDLGAVIDGVNTTTTSSTYAMSGYNEGTACFQSTGSTTTWSVRVFASDSDSTGNVVYSLATDNACYSWYNVHSFNVKATVASGSPAATAYVRLYKHETE